MKLENFKEVSKMKLCPIDPEQQDDYTPARTSEKRIHFKGRGKNGESSNKPTCVICGKDLSRSYESFELYPATDDKKAVWSKRPYGWHCKPCKYQIFD
jgi:hypothetical protein